MLRIWGETSTTREASGWDLREGGISHVELALEASSVSVMPFLVQEPPEHEVEAI